MTTNPTTANTELDLSKNYICSAIADALVKDYGFNDQYAKELASKSFEKYEAAHDKALLAEVEEKLLSMQELVPPDAYGAANGQVVPVINAESVRQALRIIKGEQ